VSTLAQTKPRADISRAKIVPIDLYRPRITGGVDLFTLEERLSYLRKYGTHCMSFSILQPEMHYFDVPGIGFMAFREKWGNRLSLADPVCDMKDREILLREFLKGGTHTTFVQISEETAMLLHNRFGFYATQFGVEILLDLENWDLKGKKKQIIRTSVNHARKEGIVFSEDCPGNGCRQLTGEWLKTRKVRNREIGFLIRPMEMEYEEGTRKFYAYLNGELVGFIFFDPIYSDNRIIGYVPNISRFSNRFKSGIFYPLMNHAMEVFKLEGVEHINLGLCPLVIEDDDMPCESGIQKKINRLLYNYGNWIFSFKGLYFTKSRYGGTETKVFGAHREKLPTIPFLVMFKLSNFM
jgi:phosphatidylglycerol lysyltransferase